MQGEALDDVAPYLVSLEKEGRLIEQLVREGWGKSWGVFVTCARPPSELRRHFRRLSIVDIEKPDGSSQQAYFRLYDPRVLRSIVPMCGVRQAAELFGEVGAFLLEGEQGEVLRFASSR